jgi:hypothetical protein
MSLLSRLYTGTATIAAAFTLAAAPTVAQTAASDLRTALNTTLAEHVYLAAATTAAALGSRGAEFKDAAGALDGNSVTLSRAIGSVYGDGAESAFLALWRKHIGFFVDYTNGLAKHDKGRQDKPKEPPPKKEKKCRGNGAKKQLISYTIRQNSSNLFSIDTKVLHLFGKKNYILVALGHDSKIAYMRAYSTHSSKASADFLARLEYLLGAKPEIILTDNGSEFQKDFDKACQTKNITRYYSRIRTPKDNPEVERMIKTFIEEWLVDGNWSPNLQQFNKLITDFLIIYNNVRPHEKLDNLTPLAYAEQNGLLSKRSSSCTKD